jgi:hypothetical protein
VPRHDDLGDRPAGIFHEVDAGDAARNCQAVSFAHFRVSEELDHSGDNAPKIFLQFPAFWGHKRVMPKKWPE